MELNGARISGEPIAVSEIVAWLDLICVEDVSTRLTWARHIRAMDVAYMRWGRAKDGG